MVCEVLTQSYLQAFASKYFVHTVKHFALRLNASTSRIATEMIKSPAEAKHEIWSSSNIVMHWKKKTDENHTNLINNHVTGSNHSPDRRGAVLSV